MSFWIWLINQFEEIYIAIEIFVNTDDELKVLIIGEDEIQFLTNFFIFILSIIWPVTIFLLSVDE